MPRGLAASGQIHLPGRIGELYISKSRYAALFGESDDGYSWPVYFNSSRNTAATSLLRVYVGAEHALSGPY
jgi:hypothetical protein